MTNIQQTATALYMSRFGTAPNYDNPTGYNEKIQYLKVFDKNPLIPDFCDKAVVRQRVPEKYLIPEAEPGLYPYMLKCSHDSGSAIRVRGPDHERSAVASLTSRLTKPYGAQVGEWGYDVHAPTLVKERYLPEAANVDFKFHCIRGVPVWLQVIWDRNTPRGAKECICTPMGEPHRGGVSMDEKMTPSMDIPNIGQDYAKLETVAAEIAGLTRAKYCRVDLYWDHGRVYFGETTFWPRSGCYRFRKPELDQWFGLLLGDVTEAR